eukprot:NODE_7020_length_475_cov_9.824713_g6854_i0.p2 GENE.NODE_7020_length_475_cov_9.824713_g6854_i0~~NODE_7020_length_475_cov_9.824713_g6854_i0.p2  ORF type:complete len:125 (-),score=27.99 NODE_7020_length_475_cov_9.824713_g6854_i0:47-421(-)
MAHRLRVLRVLGTLQVPRMQFCSKGKQYSDIIAEEMHRVELAPGASNETVKLELEKARKKAMMVYWDDRISVHTSAPGSAPAGPQHSHTPPKDWDAARDGPWNPAGAKTINVSRDRPPEWQYTP